MMFLWILLWFISVALAKIDEDKCYWDPLEKCGLKITKDLIPYNDKELKEVCQVFEKYYKCMRTNTFHKEFMKGWPEVLQHAEIAIVNVCDEDNILHHQYLETISCLLKEYEKNEAKCKDLSVKFYNVYAKYWNDGEELRRNDLAFRRCGEEAIRILCHSMHVEKACGDDGYYVFMEFTKSCRYHLTFCQNSIQFSLADRIADWVAVSLKKGIIPKSESPVA